MSIESELLEVFKNTNSKDLNGNSNISFRAFLIVNFTSTYILQNFPKLCEYYGWNEEVFEDMEK